ncbi:hypothetical protein WA026_003072 [Henosepilachna vigintioctopunctata]|uniref:Uncharacterized protein n=1 Tax=Henosepilachna vigintioctopunctata TaxID=420089 RepID=A0AAW1TM51_9CUCU
MEVMPVKRRRKNRSPSENNEQAQENVPTGDLANRKSHSYKCNLKVNGVLTQVCRGVFLKVFQISDNRIKRTNKCSVLHKSLLDLRGKSRSGNALPGNVCVGIHQHIEKFDVKETHYGGKLKKYLDARIDVAKMHDQYAELMLKDTPGKLIASEYIGGIATTHIAKNCQQRRLIRWGS